MNRDERLRRRRESYRRRMAEETPEQRNERLARRRERDRAIDRLCDCSKNTVHEYGSILLFFYIKAPICDEINTRQNKSQAKVIMLKCETIYTCK